VSAYGIFRLALAAKLKLALTLLLVLKTSFAIDEGTFGITTEVEALDD
jgi:hypothetical protein